MTINFRDNTVFYLRQGKGPTLVLLHGFLESLTMWKPLLPELTRQFDVITIDLLGHGKTGTVAEIHSMELMAEAVEAVLKAEKIKKASFVGHSMGGYVVLAFAELFPKTIENLILLNSTPLDDSITRKENRERAIVLIKKYPEAFISMGVTNLFSKENSEIYLEEIEQTKTEALLFSVEGIIANIKGMKLRDTRLEVLKNFNGKKAIIAGQEDPIIEMEGLLGISAETNTPLFKVQGGHMSHIEARDEILEIIPRFLEHSNHVQ